MAKIHIILQSKGGVGKSVFSSFLAQYFYDKGLSPICIDTDPSNQTFASYEALKVEYIKITDQQDEVSPILFDQLMQKLLSTSDDDIVVIDCGTSTFSPLIAYIVENDGFQILLEHEHEIFIHTIIAGGDRFEETENCILKLIENFPNNNLVVWLNRFFGEVSFKGQSFQERASYQQACDNEQVYALIDYPKFRHDTYGKNLSDVFIRRQTFAQSLSDPTMDFMAKARIKKVRDAIYQELLKANI